MQIRMTENHSRVDFCQTHPHGPDHKRVQTHIAHKHTDTSFPYTLVATQNGFVLHIDTLI